MRGRAIKALQEGATPLNYYPVYGGPHRLSLQQVLHGVGLEYPVTSNIRGHRVDEYITLEEFLVDVEYPQWVPKLITLSYAQELPIELNVRELFVQADVLYMRVLNITTCHGTPGLSLKGTSGLETLPVSQINWVELPGGEKWQMSF